MKKVERLILVLVCVLLLSGCVKMHTTMTINSDKSMVYENEVLFSSAIGDMSQASTNETAVAEYKSRGFSVEEIKDKDGYTGLKLSKSFKNIDELSEGNGTAVDIGEFYSKEFNDKKVFQLEKGFFKNKYTANFIYKVESTSTDDENEISDDEYSSISELDDEAGASEKVEETNGTDEPVLTIGAEEEGNDTLGDLSELTKLMTEAEFTYVVNLPVAATSNNATEVTNDGKTLTWKLSSSSNNEIKYSFELLNMTNIMIVCGGGILLILIVVIAITVASKSKNKKEENNFTPTIVNDNNVGEAPLGVDNIAGSEEVNNSIETVNSETSAVNPTVEMPVAAPVVTPEVTEEPVLENPVENMINQVGPVQEDNPMLNIEIPTIPEVPTATMEEVTTIPIVEDEGVIPLTVEPVEPHQNPEFVMPTVDGSQPVVEENKEVTNPEFVMPTVEDTGIPEAPGENNLQ